MKQDERRCKWGETDRQSAVTSRLELACNLVMESTLIL